MTKPLFTVQQVANFFFDESHRENIHMPFVKLNAIVYFAYGWVLAMTGNRLFHDTIEAWEHSPVIPALYHEFKHWGKYAIHQDAKNMTQDTLDVYIDKITCSEENKYIIKILTTVWHTHKKYSASCLKEKSCEDNSPWQRTYKKAKKHAVIADDCIRDYFVAQLGLNGDNNAKAVM